MRGIRVRDTPLDGIQIANGAYNVVIDHVSVHGAGDGNIDITENSHDVTVSSRAEPVLTYAGKLLPLHHLSAESRA